MRFMTSVAKRIITMLIAAVAVTACSGTGGDPKAGGDIVDGTKAGGDIVDGAKAVFPVNAEYAGMTWSITKVEKKPYNDMEIDLLVDMTVTNNNPFAMHLGVQVTWYWSVVSLRTADGVTLPNLSSVSLLPEIGVDEKIKEQISFRADSDLDVNGLSLVVGDEGSIPEVVPFAGGAEAKPYPVDLTVEGKVTTEMSCPHSVVQTMTPVKARVDVGVFDVRASIGHRIVALDLKIEVAPGRAGFLGSSPANCAILLEADGEGIAVSRSPWPDKHLAPGTSGTVTLVFEIPTDTTKLALVFHDRDGGTHRIPIGITPLPACCGE